jgi:hypothetical protein
MKLKQLVVLILALFILFWIYVFYKDSMENNDGRNSIQMDWLANGILLFIAKNNAIPKNIEEVRAVCSDCKPPYNAPAFGDFGKDIWNEPIRFQVDTASGVMVLESSGENKKFNDKDDYLCRFAIKDSIGYILPLTTRAKREYLAPPKWYRLRQ